MTASRPTKIGTEESNCRFVINLFPQNNKIQNFPSPEKKFTANNAKKNQVNRN